MASAGSTGGSTGRRSGEHKCTYWLNLRSKAKSLPDLSSRNLDDRAHSMSPTPLGGFSNLMSS